jgi:O-antigen/teichoic acid export membrane protein
LHGSNFCGMSFKKTTFRHIFQIGSYKYAAHVLNFMASVILARLLLPEEYGLVAMIMVVANFARILSGEGIASDIIRSKYGYTYHKSLMNLAIFLGFIPLHPCYTSGLAGGPFLR